MASIEGGSREMSTAAYIRWTARSERVPYEERWGTGFASIKPDRIVMVTTRQIPRIEWVMNGDKKMIRIPVIPSNRQQ